jgi:hypothetical protein
LINPADGERIIKLISSDPAIEDQQFIVAQINDKIANGIDASSDILSNADKMKSSTFISLSKANSQMVASSREDVDIENERRFRREFLQTDPWGFSVPSDERMYNDIIDVYRKDRSNNVDPGLAFEKMRVAGELARESLDQDKKQYFNKIHLNTKIDPETKKIDYKATAQALNESDISREDLLECLFILNALREKNE